MDKLTQFVSKSFESNNNAGEQCLNLSFDARKTSVKTEKEFVEERTKKPKNWLISDIENNGSSQTQGCIDLRLNLNNAKNDDSDKEKMSADVRSDSVIEHCESYSDALLCDKREDCSQDVHCDNENSNNKVCKYIKVFCNSTSSGTTEILAKLK